MMFTNSSRALLCARFIVSPPAILLVAALFSGCEATPPMDVEASRAVGDGAGLGVPVEFVAVGADGGPLDEPDVVGERLTLAEALRRAVTTDPGLQAALARVRIALADADQARLLPTRC